MSIICGTIRWLKDHKHAEKQNLLDEISECQSLKKNIIEGNDWIVSQSKGLEISQKLIELMMRMSRIQDYEKKLEGIKNHEQFLPKNTLDFKNDSSVEDSNDSDDDNVIVDISSIKDYSSEDEEDGVEAYESIKV